jgi:site-specific DNA recombinase
VRAAIYARISQDRVGAGLGVARQREDCQQLVADRGWTLTGVYEDNDISAYSGKLRPGYRQLLDDIHGGQIDAVVAWHTDRLHRSPRELEEWIDACERGNVITVTVRAGELDLATAAGRMVARMLGAAARHESEQKGERVRRAREQAAHAGKAHGNLGYGYRRDPVSGSWQIEPDEARIVREIAARILAGEPLYAIVVDLNQRQVPTPSKASYGWRAPNLRHMIVAGRYCGWREWTPASTRGGRGRGRGLGELICPGDWPAILTRDETEQLRRLLTDPSRRTGGRTVAYLLSGILRCGRCGAPLNGHRDRKRQTRRYACIAQPGLNRCGRLTITGTAADDYVTAALFAALADTPLPSPDADPRTRTTEDAAFAALDNDRHRLDELATDYAEGRITRQEWLRVRDIVAARIDTTTASLPGDRHSRVLRHLPTSSAQIAAAWPTMTLDQQRTVMNAVVERIIVRPAEKSTRQFDPARIEIHWRV